MSLVCTSIQHEQSQLVPFLLPRKEFSKEEERVTQYLRDIISHPSSSNATVQILRSVSEWSSGTPTEHSILDAYRHAIDNAEHFIYVEVCVCVCAYVCACAYVRVYVHDVYV